MIGGLRSRIATCALGASLLFTGNSGIEGKITDLNYLPGIKKNEKAKIRNQVNEASEEYIGVALSRPRFLNDEGGFEKRPFLPEKGRPDIKVEVATDLNGNGIRDKNEEWKEIDGHHFIYANQFLRITPKVDRFVGGRIELMTVYVPNNAIVEKLLTGIIDQRNLKDNPKFEYNISGIKGIYSRDENLGKAFVSRPQNFRIYFGRKGEIISHFDFVAMFQGDHPDTEKFRKELENK